MAKNKLVKGKNIITFEKDEKKSIIIALVVSAVVVLATVLAIVAIRNKGGHGASGTSDGQETTVSESITEQLTDDGSIIVTNQQELDKKLTASVSDDTIGSITIQSEEEQSIEITEGDYSNVALNVDAPYTEVSNYANFNTINISQISANTWVEHASGNNIILQAPSSHVIIESDAQVESISNITYGSTLAIEIFGTVKNLSLEADDSISSVSVNGKLEALDIYSKTNLALSGSFAEKLPVNMQSGADGSVIRSTIPVYIQAYGAADYFMEAGAEDSSIALLSGDGISNVYNNTAAAVAVNDSDGNENSIEAGDTKKFVKERTE